MSFTLAFISSTSTLDWMITGIDPFLSAVFYRPIVVNCGTLSIIDRAGSIHLYGLPNEHTDGDTQILTSLINQPVT